MRESAELESGVGVEGRESSWNQNPKTTPSTQCCSPSPPPAPQEGPRDLLPSWDGVLEGTAGQKQGTQWTLVKKNEETHQHALRQENETVLGSWEWMECTRRMLVTRVAQASALHPAQLLPSK